jgi:tetratricopeptide (TPR) repeat protein
MSDEQAAGKSIDEKAEALIREGVTLYEAEDYDGAIEKYTEAITLKPAFALAYANRGDTYRLKNRYDAALKDLDKALRLNPDYARAYNVRGLVYDAKGEWDKAIADYSEAIRCEPEKSLYYANRGNTYYNKNQYDAAIKDLDKALSLNPDNTYAQGLREKINNEKTEARAKKKAVCTKMRKVFISVTIGAIVLVSLVWFFRSFKAPDFLRFWETKQDIVIENIPVLGPLNGYIEVVPGNYEMQLVSGKGGLYDLNIGLKIKALQPYDDTEMLSQLELRPLDQEGTDIHDAVLKVSESSFNRLKTYMNSQQGESLTVTFSNPVKNVKSVMKRIKGFELTIGYKAVIAVPVLERAPNVNAAEAAAVRNAIVAGLMGNRAAERYSLVDTGRIDQIMQQHNFELSDWSSSNKVTEIGKALNANTIVYGTIYSTSNNLRNLFTSKKFNLSLNFLNINTMEIISSFVITEDVEGIKAGIEKLALDRL